MKIRIKGNSVRLRLTKTDIRNLGETGQVQESTSFVSNRLNYKLQQTNEAILSADFTKNTITVFIPQAMAETLVATTQIGFDGRQATGDNETLYILIEKDFQCIDHTTEDQSDMYINPNKTC